MPTNAELYNHDAMNNDALEARISADLLELSRRIGPSNPIGGLLWGLMAKIREAYRTHKLIAKES